MQGEAVARAAALFAAREPRGGARALEQWSAVPARNVAEVGPGARHNASFCDAG
jgi:hypothetical protein